MSSAIILPIFYDRQMRQTNRRELFVKRFTSGCVVIATLFIVVGLSSATWYMTILGTFILMIVGLSGFCLKYCDRTTDSRAVRRAISISSRLTRPSTRRAVPNVCPSDTSADDLPPAYDNIVFDEPYSLGTASYHIRTYDHPISPPPPYEAIFNATSQPTTGHAINQDHLPAYSSIAPRSRSVPTTLVVPRFSLNQYNRQSVCLSHAIGLTITSSQIEPGIVTREAVTRQTHPEVTGIPQTIGNEPSRVVTLQSPREVTSENAVANETSRVVTRQAPREIASGIPQTGTHETSRSITRQASRTTSADTCQRPAPESHKIVAHDTSTTQGKTARHGQLNHTGEQSGTNNSPNYRSVQRVDVSMNVEIINNTESVTSDSDTEVTSDSSETDSSTSKF